jgi:hypothetical protein
MTRIARMGRTWFCSSAVKKAAPKGRRPKHNEINRTGSDSLLDHEFEQVSYAAAVAPFIVVPAHKLEETLVQLDPGALIENGGGL